MLNHHFPASSSSHRARAALRVLLLAFGATAATPAIVAAQVTYFHHPPTVEQLREALLPPAARPPAAATGAGGARPSGSRTRGIVLDAGAAPGPQPATVTGTPAGAALYAAPGEAPGVGSGGAYGGAAGTAPGVRYGTTPSATATAILAGRASAASAGSTMPVNERAAALPINFDLGSSRVDRASLPYLERVASLLREEPGLQLLVEGHTDDRGSFSRNMVLSWDRAIGVYRSLVETYGVDPRRLQLQGKGPQEPLPGTDPRDGSNRRVQFRLNG